MRGEETRARLISAALELVAAQGFEETTAAEIARRAGVSEMTFFRHFPTKASVLVDDPYDPLIADAIRRRPATESAWEATVKGIADAWRAVPAPEATAVRERMAIIAATPSLRAALAEGSAATTSAIQASLDGRAPGSEAAVVAAAIVAGLNEALLGWATGDGELGAAILDALRVMGDR